MKRSYLFCVLLSALISLKPVCYAQSTPAFVQGAAFLDTTFNAASVSVTFASAPTPGNTVIVGCIGDGGSTTLAPDGVTDDQGNTYTQMVFQNYIGSGQPTALYVASNVGAAGPLTVTCSGLDNVDAIDIFAVEYSGLAKEAPLDGQSIGVAQTGDYPRTCGIVQTTAQNDLIVAVFNNDAVNSPALITPLPNYVVPVCSGGFAGACASQDGSTSQLGAMITAIADMPGNYSPGFSGGPSGSGSQSICVAVALKAGGP